jgi:UDP-2,4-diacetamido-2,4,6-trideoxy-beta-L-altropyranose hydrolase
MKVVHIGAEAGSAADASETADHSRKMEGVWVVLDGYHFDSAYQKKIKDSGLRLLVIDDVGAAHHYWADIVLNQNLHADEYVYRETEPYTQLLLGSKYVLLRREYLDWREWQREIRDPCGNILVTMGGSDPGNISLRIIRALEYGNVGRLEVLVVVGGNNPHYGTLRRVSTSDRIHMRLVRNTVNMPDLMAWADVAVSSGGTTVWELAFMALPSVVGITAPVEEVLVGGLEERGLFTCLGWLEDETERRIAGVVMDLLDDRDARAAMSRLGRVVVDGRGCDRVVNLMMSAQTERI